MPSVANDPGLQDRRAPCFREASVFARLLRLSSVVVLILTAFTPTVRAQGAPGGVEDSASASDEATVPVASDELDAAAPAGERAEEPADPERPWAFSLGLYMWLPGVYAELSSGLYETSISESIVDIFEATDGIPLTFGGAVEGWWKGFGLYADGNVFYLDFKDQTVNGREAGVLTRIGLLEYSALFRVTGAPLAAEVASWAEKDGPPRLDLYAGGRTLWLKNEIEPEGLPSASAEETMTSPLVGGRVAVDLDPRWFLLLDGNVGGFGVDDVDFTGEGLASFGYRTRLLGAPIVLSLGYKVLYLKVETEKRRRRLGTDTVLHGPALELTFAF